MNERTDPSLELKDFTIETCYNSGLGELIDDIVREQELLTFEDKSSIPIPVESLEEGSLEIEIKPEISDIISAYTEIINNPETALEFPFLLSGKQSPRGEITTFSPLYSNIENLKNKEILMSDYSKELSKKVSESKKQDQDILVLGHTHPKPTKQNSETLLTNKLSPQIKEKYHIKELGLNLSLQDLYQLAYFEQAIKGTVKEGTKAMMCVIMFNGDSTYLYIEDGKFKKAKIKQKGKTTAPSP
jgi:hypothetical protein